MYRKCFFFLILIGSPLLFLLSTAVWAGSEGLSSEVAFAEVYAGIIRDVHEGKLAPEKGKIARTLNSELQNKINRIDGRLETLKTEVAGLQGKERDAALDRLVATGAAKERIYAEYTARLEALLNGKNNKVVQRTTPTSKDPTESGQINSAQPEGESFLPNITFEPEDVTSGEFD